MAIPFLDDYDASSMTDDDKWRLIADTIDYAISEGLTQTRAKEALRAKGYTFGNTPFSQLWQDLRDYRVSFEYATTLPVTVVPDPERMATQPYIEAGHYRYKGYVVSIDPDTGVQYEHWATVDTDSLLTAQEAKAALQKTIYEDSPPVGEIVSGVFYGGAERGL